MCMPVDVCASFIEEDRTTIRCHVLGGLTGIKLANQTIVQFITLPFPLSVHAIGYTNINTNTQKGSIKKKPGYYRLPLIFWRHCIADICSLCGRIFRWFPNYHFCTVKFNVSLLLIDIVLQCWKDVLIPQFCQMIRLICISHETQKSLRLIWQIFRFLWAICSTSIYYVLLDTCLCHIQHCPPMGEGIKNCCWTSSNTAWARVMCYTEMRGPDCQMGGQRRFQEGKKLVIKRT